jgi:putative endonuclease
MREDVATRRTARRAQALGARAEAIVCAHLVDRGYAIVARNARVGRKEIDVIARRGRLFVFCEVRARARAGFVSPLATIDRAKVQRIRAAAAQWLRDRRARGFAVRFDAAAVTFDDPEGTLDYVENAF